MASAAAAQSSEEVGGGGTYSRPISGAKAPSVRVAVSTANESLVDACSAQAAVAVTATVQPLGNNAGVCWGNGFSVGSVATAGVEIGVEDGVVRRSVVDVIAEAMRENSVQHHHRVSRESRNDSSRVGHQQQQPGAVQFRHYSSVLGAYCEDVTTP